MGNGLTHAAVVVTADDGVSEVGSNEWNAKHTIATLELTGVITPTALSANTNDYAPTGAAGASVWRLSTDGGSYDLTGIAAMTDGTVLVLTCTAGTLNIRHQSTSSTAANRFRMPGGGTGSGNFLRMASTGGSVVVKYNAVDQRWDTLAWSLSQYRPTSNPLFATSVVDVIASSNGTSGFYGMEATTSGITFYINDASGATGELLMADGAGLVAWTTPGRDANTLNMQEAMG